MNYYSFHVGDYAVATRHLSLMEDLAYRRMLDLYYTREAALPADVGIVARLVGMRDDIDPVRAVLEEFFTLGPDGWAHFRCDFELRKMQDLQNKAVAAGKASAIARAKSAKRKLNGRSTDAQRPLN